MAFAWSSHTCEPYTTEDGIELCIYNFHFRQPPIQKLPRIEVGNVAARFQDRYSDAVTQGCTPPLSSHGSCRPMDEYTPLHCGGMQLGRQEQCSCWFSILFALIITLSTCQLHVCMSHAIMIYNMIGSLPIYKTPFEDLFEKKTFA